MEKKERKRYFQDSLFVELQADICYVCCRKIAPSQAVCVGQGLWRHRTCKPGSRKWSQNSPEERRSRTDRS
jgi:hypothetical protein